MESSYCRELDRKILYKTPLLIADVKLSESKPAQKPKKGGSDQYVQFIRSENIRIRFAYALQNVTKLAPVVIRSIFSSRQFKYDEIKETLTGVKFSVQSINTLKESSGYIHDTTSPADKAFITFWYEFLDHVYESEIDVVQHTLEEVISAGYKIEKPTVSVTHNPLAIIKCKK